MTWFIRLCGVWWCLFPLFALSSPVYAAPDIEVASADQQDVIETREVVVSATKTPIPVSQVTSAVEIITGEELERKKIKTVIDGLRLAQGVFATSSGGPGTEATVKMRGAFARHTLVLIDGVIVNSPTTGAYDFSNLTAENIDRIEILRGAQSMLYGSDAVGGVINIYTKKGTGTPTASTFIEYGSFASLREGGSASGSKGPFDFSASISRWDTSSFSAINYRRGAFERDGFHNWQGSGKLGVSLPNDGRLEFNARWYNSDGGFDGFADSGAPADVFGAKQSTRNLILSGTYEQPLTSWWTQKLTLAQANERSQSVSGNAGYNLNTKQFISANPQCSGPPFLINTDTCFTPFSSDLKILNRRLEWQHNFQIGKPLLLSAGYQFREEQGDAPAFYGPAQPNKLISSHAGFAQAQVSLWDRLDVTGGVRQDSYNIFGDATTYRVTAGYLVKETGTKFRGSYATGFKAPTFNDLFFQLPGQDFGNPNLKPEKSKSMDVGIDQSLFQGRVQLNAGYFWNRFQDLIQFASSFTPLCPASTLGFCPINVAEAKSQGWELGFKATIMEGLQIRGQYTYTMTRAFDTPSNPLGGDKRLPRWPVDQATLGLTYQPIEPLRINVDYRFVGARNNNLSNTPNQQLGSFNVVNASATYDVTRNWQVFGRVDNIFNARYEEILYFGTPVRSVYGGVKFTY
ncbi:MAG: TonB-dependent receptor [Nitrospira sp.]|nr:MAG: TonB-dependent receptor [Nitrospira sp.]